MRRGLEAWVWVAVAGCGDDGSDATAATLATASSSAEATDAGAPTTGGAPRLDLGAPDCGLDNGDLGLSFIWIANSTQGTVSKIDTVRPAEVDAGAGIHGLTRPSPAALQRRRLSAGGPRPRA